MKQKMGTSPAFSFKFWDVWVWAKGRKRSAITALAAIIFYKISDEATASIIAGGIIEAIFAIVDYYVQKKQFK